MDSFVAIDFETARWGVACAVGLVHFENGKPIDERYTLIDPRISPRRWDAGAIRVHGITPADVIGQPTFTDIWPELVHYAACYPLVAHNANFDMGVLRGELERANLQTPTVRYGCSMALARNAWPKSRRGAPRAKTYAGAGTEADREADAQAAAPADPPDNHKLDTLSSYLSIDLDHHNALSDAIACGMITVAAVQALGYNTLAAAYEHPRLNWGEISPELTAVASSKW
ncbi:MAG: 3'-5' exonuclease [Actinobacteria bacterium]|nr:3'-5' exonuclease [Actinomycetota bacterium]